jgi:hypothetical protein
VSGHNGHRRLEALRAPQRPHLGPPQLLDRSWSSFDSLHEWLGALEIWLDHKRNRRTILQVAIVSLLSGVIAAILPDVIRRLRGGVK